jgi:zinc protease
MALSANRVAGLLVLTASILHAQNKEQPPAPAAEIGFALPGLNTTSLPNGMKVTAFSHGDLPLVRVTLIIRTGAIDEGPDQVWLSKLMADMMQQGTTTRSAAALADAVAGMGGDLAINAGFDDLSISGTVLGDSAAAFVRLLGDVARHPKFPESELSRLIGDRQRQLAIAKTQPQQIAAERYAKLMYPDHPYGRLFPTSAALGSYTTAQVSDFYARNVDATRSHLMVVGKFDAGKVQQAIETTFSDWVAGSPPSVNVPPAHAERTLVLIDRPGAVQSTLDVGLRVADDPSNADWIPLVATDALLGGSFNSRITSNIREQKGYTYSPFSTVTAHYRSAAWTESADVTTSATGASLKEIFGEIDRLRATPPSDDEVKSIQHYLDGVFVLRNSTPAGLTGQLEFMDIHGLDNQWFVNYIPAVNRVTPADMQSMAQKYLDPSKMSIVVAGDKKVVADQLTPYGSPVQ